MSLAYTTWLNSFATMLVATTSDPNFTTIVPDAIDYAEQRMYRELDLVNTRVLQTTTLTTGTRILNLPSAAGTFVVADRINVITPASATTANAGTRNPLMPTSQDTIDFMFPSTAYSSVPVYFAMNTQTMAMLGPAPDQPYLVEVSGTIRPPALSTTNVTTLLTVYLPDVFLAATMIFGAGYQKNFGAQSSDPQSALAWEQQYQTLLKSAEVEEFRKKFGSEGWSAKQPDPLATPPRT